MHEETHAMALSLQVIYPNTPGTPFAPIQDTAAFDTCD